MSLAVGVSGVDVLLVYVGCAFGKERVLAVCCWWLGQWAFGALPLLPFHYLPHSTREGFPLFSSMAHRRHLILGHPTILQKLMLVPLSIPSEATAVEPVHPK